MSTEVTVPPLGEAAGGTVTRWFRAVGDLVEVDEPLVEVSTDKAEVELPCPADGILLEILVKPGQSALVGTVLALIGNPDGASGGSPTGGPLWLG